MMTAAAAAIEHGWSDLQTYRTEMTTRRNMVLEYLELAGLAHMPVAGALYAFIKIPDRFGGDDVAFALQMAHEAKVGVIPGSVFGSGGEGYIRLSFAVNTEKLREALQRMIDFLKEN
jgi:aminotransferase